MFVLYRPPPQPVLCQSWWRWWVNIMLSGVMPVSRAGPSYLSSHCSRQPPAELQYFPANLPHNKRPFYPQQTYNHKKWKLIKTIPSRHSSQISLHTMKVDIQEWIGAKIPDFSPAGGGLFLIRLHNVSRCWTVSHQGVWAITDWGTAGTQSCRAILQSDIPVITQIMWWGHTATSPPSTARGGGGGRTLLENYSPHLRNSLRALQIVLMSQKFAKINWIIMWKKFKIIFKNIFHLFPCQKIFFLNIFFNSIYIWITNSVYVILILTYN